MKNSNLFYNSIINGTCVDGQGLRSIIFFSGCNLRCKFCHNIEIVLERGIEISPQQLFEKLKKFTPYIKKGGVTFSGGEPFLQAENLVILAKLLKSEGLNIAIETNGSIANEELISLADEIILDKKDETDVEIFLRICEKQQKKLTLTKVIIENENDNQATIDELVSLKNNFSCIEAIRLLPFSTLCKEKYEKLGLDSSYFDRKGTSEEIICKLYSRRT